VHPEGVEVVSRISSNAMTRDYHTMPSLSPLEQNTAESTARWDDEMDHNTRELPFSFIILSRQWSEEESEVEYTRCNDMDQENPKVPPDDMIQIEVTTDQIPTDSLIEVVDR
jgi:hypothetical protein